MSGQVDFYRVLGVAREASQEEIRAAFERRAAEVRGMAHLGDPERQRLLNGVKAALDVLGDEARRIAYDNCGRDAALAGRRDLDDLLERLEDNRRIAGLPPGMRERERVRSGPTGYLGGGQWAERSPTDGGRYARRIDSGVPFAPHRRGDPGWPEMLLLTVLFCLTVSAATAAGVRDLARDAAAGRISPLPACGSAHLYDNGFSPARRGESPAERGRRLERRLAEGDGIACEALYLHCAVAASDTAPHILLLRGFFHAFEICIVVHFLCYFVRNAARPIAPVFLALAVAIVAFLAAAAFGLRYFGALAPFSVTNIAALRAVLSGAWQGAWMPLFPVLCIFFCRRRDAVPYTKRFWVRHPLPSAAVTSLFLLFIPFVLYLLWLLLSVRFLLRYGSVPPFAPLRGASVIGRWADGGSGQFIFLTAALLCLLAWGTYFLLRKIRAGSRGEGIRLLDDIRVFAAIAGFWVLEALWTLMGCQTAALLAFMENGERAYLWWNKIPLGLLLSYALYVAWDMIRDMDELL